MLFRTHVVFGLVVWLVLSFFIKMPVFVLGFVLLGSVFVDIDSCSSKIGKRFWFLAWFLRHRGVLHSLVACIVLSLVVGVLNLWMGFGFFIGYVSHLVLDCFTRRGIGLFWPFDFRVRGFVRSGSWVEDVIFVLILILIGLYFVGRTLAY
ncbi:MAG TPA: metal-dependent hydrolase [Candidatus Pacearchaeota archaeon]|nr:metal-dependent hydrolase [Candidatus Pacearchaeota archaeon]